jgi:NAD+ diphosphatase
VTANAFTGAPLDRAVDPRKDPDWVAAQREHPAARALVAGDAGVRVTGGEEPRLALLPLAAVTDGGDPILLGLDADGPVFAVDAERDGPVPRPLVGGAEGSPWPAPGTTGPVGLRDAVGALPLHEGGLVAYGSALINWHRRHGRCSVCGTATQPRDGGVVRVCPQCGTHHFPRTDPVVIMAVHDGAERLLMGRQPSWPAGRYSTLAGFVEAGESLEEAVAREVREEAGVEIETPRYVSSQPWPFPGSLMLGFMAQWRSGELHRQEEEMDDVRWFSRSEVEAAVASAAAGDGPLRLPRPYAIARRLIEDWLARAAPRG